MIISISNIIGSDNYSDRLNVKYDDNANVYYDDGVLVQYEA